MKKIKKLYFYDFDGTLISSPEPEEGKLIWKSKKGEDYPYEGWWGRKETLDLDVFDIQPNKTVLNQFRDDQRDVEGLTILLTSRVIKLKDALLKVLERHDIIFDEYSLKYDSKDKSVRIKEYLEKYKDVTEISLYDARENEFILFKELKKELEGKIKVNIYKVQNGNISLLENESKLKSIINEEIKNYCIYNKK